jgi:hypothetical protein
MQSLQAAEVQMEGEIALDSVGESSTACERFSDDEAESPTTNQSFLDDDGGSSAVKLLLLGNAGGSSLLTELKHTMFHRIKYTKFTQQELPAWKPMITPKCGR